MLVLYLMALDSEQERDAMTRIYLNNRAIMKAVALKVMNGDDAAAEDATHSAFVSIMEHKEKYFLLSEEEMRRLAVTIVKRKAVDILRKRKHVTDVPLDDLYELESPQPSVEYRTEVLQDFEKLIQYIRELDDDSKTIVIMKNVHALTFKEIGALLNMPIRTVETKYYRAKSKIIKKFEEEVSHHE